MWSVITLAIWKWLSKDFQRNILVLVLLTLAMNSKFVEDSERHYPYMASQSQVVKLI